MKPSFREFVRYIKEKEIPEEKAEELNNLLFPPKSRRIMINDLVKTGLYDQSQAYKVFLSLEDSHVIEIEFVCRHCGHTGLLKDNLKECSYCGGSFKNPRE